MKSNFIHIVLGFSLIVGGCKVNEKIEPAADSPPIANFGIYNAPGSLTFSSFLVVDSSKFAVLYELDYGDGFIRKDSLIHNGFGKVLGGHSYIPTDSSRTFQVTFKVFNKKGESDSKTKKVVVSLLPDKIPTIDDSVRVGYYNTPGEITGLINDQLVQFESNDTTSFSGAMLFNQSSNYYYSMLFSNGISRCKIKETFAILLPIYSNDYGLFERNAPLLQYQIIGDSLKVGKSFWFNYIVRSELNGAEEGYRSNVNATLKAVKEVEISTDFYYSVYEKGYDATFTLKSDEFVGSAGKKLDKKMDIVIKMRLLFDRRNRRPFVNVTSIGYCF